MTSSDPIEILFLALFLVILGTAAGVALGYYARLHPPREGFDRDYGGGTAQDQIRAIRAHITRIERYLESQGVDLYANHKLPSKAPRND